MIWCITLVTAWFLRHHLAFAWSRLRGRRHGSSMLTASGVVVHPLDMRPETIWLEDVAAGLANACRYAGHVRWYYSVAEHSVAVSIAVERWARNAGKSSQDATMLAREALLHDAEEAYLGDMIRPLKHSSRMRWFRRAGDRLRSKIYARFDVASTPESAALVKRFDNWILNDEAALRRNAATLNDEVALRGYAAARGEPIGVGLRCWEPAAAEYAFFCRFVELWPELFPGFEVTRGSETAAQEGN